MNSMSAKSESWAGEVKAITLFVEDKERTRVFYEDIFSLKKVFEDTVSVAFEIGGMILNFINFKAAEELISPVNVGTNISDSRLVLTIEVKNVDTKCRELKSLGINVMKGPIDRPWGIRTANFADPDGYIWEIASPIGA